MQTSSKLAFGSEGYKVSELEASLCFRWRLSEILFGGNADDRDPAKGGFTNRARLDFREKVAGEGFMVMQPANPVFAVKLSAPKQIENKEGDNATMWIEFYWHNPYNGKQDEPMAHDGGGGLWGLKPKSFDLFTAVCPWKKDEFWARFRGVEICKQNGRNRGDIEQFRQAGPEERHDDVYEAHSRWLIRRIVLTWCWPSTSPPSRIVLRICGWRA